MSRSLDRSERAARLHDLAARLGACVIDPGTGSPVDAALFAAAPLQLHGLVCCHTEDIAAVARAGATGTFVADIPPTFPPDTTAAFASIRFDDNTSLAEIGGICERITNRLPEDGALFVAATPGPPFGVSAVLFTC